VKVTVHLPGVLRPAAANQSTMDIELAGAATLHDLLNTLAAEYPGLDRRLRTEQRELRRYVNFYIGDEECRRLNGPATVLTDGTTVQIIPSVAGG
jgi:molybdopterin converting factor small subunit